MKLLRFIADLTIAAFFFTDHSLVIFYMKKLFPVADGVIAAMGPILPQKTNADWVVSDNCTSKFHIACAEWCRVQLVCDGCVD